MKVLIAEDEIISRTILHSFLNKWGFEVVVTKDGLDAWAVLQGADAPRLAVLDWMMPGLQGPEICRRLRSRPSVEPTYVILLTARGGKDDIVQGLDSGANDYIIKPFDRDELEARLNVGRGVAELQTSLAARIRDLEEALRQVKQLQTLMPICCYCKKVRTDENYWQQVETYLESTPEVQVTQSTCPACRDAATG